MKIKIVLFLLLSSFRASLMKPSQRKLINGQQLSKIIDDKKLMNCLFQNSIQQDQVQCIESSNQDQQYKESIEKVQSIIQSINDKEKSCKQIIDQQNFINCRKKIVFEIKNEDKNDNEDIELIAHIFTAYLNSQDNIQQKLKETQQQFDNFVNSNVNNPKGQTNLKINIDQEDNSQKEIASQFIQQVQNQKHNAKEVISQNSPKNLSVEMLDHTVEKFSLEKDKDQKANDQADTQIQKTPSEDLNEIKNDDDLKLVNEKIKTYEALGKSNDVINFLFTEVSKKLEELKREEERNKVLKEEKEKINKDLKQEIYSKNLDDSTQKINLLRQQITDHLIYCKSLINQKQLDLKIIRKLQSLDQLKKTYIKFDYKGKKIQRRLQQSNKKIKSVNKMYKDQIVLLKKGLKHERELKHKNLKRAIQDQNTQLRIKHVIRKLVKKQKIERQIERKLVSEKEQQYENIQGFEVLESIQKIHSMQQSLLMEEKVKSEILQRIQNLIKWKEISIRKQQENNQQHDKEQEKFFIRINITYHQQIRYMLDALQNVEKNKFKEQITRIKMLQDRRKKIKAKQLLTEEFDVSAFQNLEKNEDFQELMEQNMKVERSIAKQSSQLQRLRSEFMKNKNIIDYETNLFHKGLEKNKKQMLKKMHQKNAENIKEFLSKKNILFVLCSFILIQIIQLQYVISIVRRYNQ